jgi:cytochrome b561
VLCISQCGDGRKETIMAAKSTEARYGSVAVAVHWTSAAVIFVALGSGLAMGIVQPSVKLPILMAHLAAGGTALLLTLARVVWWLTADRRPTDPPGQPAWQAVAARAVHYLLYAAILILGASGIATLALSGAVPALLAGAPLPDLSQIAPRLAHGVMSKVLIALLAGHIGAALWHQFIRHDRLLARMGLGAGL